MGRIWIVRLEADDGTDLDGRLEVTADEIRFTPGTHGALAPAVVVPTADIVSVETTTRGMSHRIHLAVRDGRRLMVDHGVRPADELAALLRPSSPTPNPRDAAGDPTEQRTTS